MKSREEYGGKRGQISLKSEEEKLSSGGREVLWYCTHLDTAVWWGH